MIHTSIPQYIREAAAEGKMCNVLRITVRNNTVTNETTVPIDGALALKIFSIPQSERRGLYSRIRPIGETFVPVVPVSALSDEALRLEFEKRGLETPKKEAKEPKEPKPKKDKPEMAQDSPETAMQDTGSDLSDPLLNPNA